jgi:hypothetical protein
LFGGATPPFRDCDVLVVTVEGVNEGVATNAQPPTVLLRIEEVLSGFMKADRVQAVWSEVLRLQCAVGEEPRIAAWQTARVEGPVPRLGERWIVAGGMSRDRQWFQVVPDNRVRFTPAARADALRRLKEELVWDPAGPRRRRWQHAEDHAVFREYELIGAVKAGDGPRVRRLLRSGVRASATDNDGKSALVWAVETGAFKTARLLLGAGARMHGDNPEPVRNVDGAYMTELDAALLRAAADGNCEAIEILVKGGARAGMRGRRGTTPLIYAAGAGGPECLRVLIAGGADPNGSDNFGVTALMRAAEAGRSGSVELLLRHGADPTRRHFTGRMALDYAVFGSEAPALTQERRAEYAIVIQRLERNREP